MLLIAAAIAGVALLAGAVVVIAGAASGPSSADALREAGCTIKTYPTLERNHVEQLEKGFKYNSDPPTSGPHNPQWAPWGVYSEQIEQYRLVHNLEHGGVVIQYGKDVPDDTATRIFDWYRDNPNGIIVAPYDKLGARIGLTAWNQDSGEGGAEDPPGTGYLASCTTFDEGAFDAFVESYGFQGPEPFPKERLAPGT